MADKFGGGAEKYARFKQYDYRAVSSCSGFQGHATMCWSAGRGHAPLSGGV